MKYKGYENPGGEKHEAEVQERHRLMPKHTMRMVGGKMSMESDGHTDWDQDIVDRQAEVEKKYRAAGLWGGDKPVESYGSDLVDVYVCDHEG